MFFALFSLCFARGDKDIKRSMSEFIGRTIKSEVENTLRSMEATRRLHSLELDMGDPANLDGNQPESVQMLQAQVKALQERLNKLQKSKEIEEKHHKKFMARRQGIAKFDELARASVQQQ